MRPRNTLVHRLLTKTAWSARRRRHSLAGWRLAVAGERSSGTAWSVHVDVDADDVARRLEQQHGYPLDMDAIGHGLSVRFAVIAAA